LSTGIKYLLHSLATILDRIETNSMIIFDEPENHIQPPLLCKFLYCLRILSNEYTSLVLVATHSPVILQETLKKNVLVVKREGNRFFFRCPRIETFGENIGNITDEVFNLNTSVTNYQNTARKVFSLIPPEVKHMADPISYLKYVESETQMQFGNEINAYLISLLLERKENNDVES
ncbi:MAG: AAA family ATPase, partial [Clostridia bacterium]|nr:AAA family ATPase [Clostridia bacterium]